MLVAHLVPEGYQLNGSINYKPTGKRPELLPFDYSGRYLKADGAKVAEAIFFAVQGEYGRAVAILTALQSRRNPKKRKAKK